MVLGRRARAAVFFLIGVIAGFSIVGIAAISATSKTAIQQSVDGNLAEAGFTIQASTGQAARSVSSLGLTAVADSIGSATAEDSQLPIVVRRINEPGIPLSTLVAGRRSESTSEVTLSQTVATTLRVSLNGHVRIEWGGRDIEALIVGITVDPANNNDAIAVLYDPKLSSQDITVWLSETDPYRNGTLRPLLDRRTATYRTTELLRDDASRNLPHQVQMLKFVPAGLAGLAALLIAGTCAMFVPGAQRDVKALQAARLPVADAWNVTAAAAYTVISIGYLSGTFLVLCLVSQARSQVSASIGQDWTSVTPPWITVVVVLLVVIGIGQLAPTLIRRASSSGLVRRFMRGPELRSSLVGRRWAIAAAIAAAGLLVGPAVAKMVAGPSQFTSLSLFGAILTLALLVRAVDRTILARFPSGVRAYARGTVPGVLFPVGVLAAVGLICANHVAVSTHDSYVIENLAIDVQPSGSLLLTEVPSAAASTIMQEYHSYSAAPIRRFDLPDEDAHQLRVTSPLTTNCMRDLNIKNPAVLDEACLSQGTRAPINVVALSNIEFALADPALIQGGKVGLIYFDTNAAAAKLLADTHARPDEALGGNMPGVVLPLDGPAARAFDLRPSGRELVALLDFASLRPTDQSRMRAVISRVAPSAQVADATGANEFAHTRSVATGESVAVGALLGLLLLVVGLGVLSGTAQARRIVVDIGSEPRRRYIVLTLWVWPAIAMLVLAELLNVAIAHMRALPGQGEYGPITVFPFAIRALITVLLGVLALRVPARLSE